VRAVTQSDQLGPVATLMTQKKQMGSGTFLLTSYSKVKGESGRIRIQVALEDATGRVTGIAWPEAHDAILVPPVPSPVSVMARVRRFNDKPYLNLLALAGVGADAVGRATDLLPRHRCGDSVLAAFERLASLEASLPEPLGGFLREVLLDPVIGVPFLRCRGSVRHHHALVGGLLVHSTEFLDIAETVVRFVLPNDEWSPHLAKLGYLLHDLGKLRSVGEYRRPDYGLTARHETMTIEMIAPHLSWLERREPKLAVGLRAVFEYLSIPYHARPIPNYFVAELVAKLDQWSAAAYEPKGLDYLLINGWKGKKREPLQIRDAANDPLHDQELPDAG
jgi:3'-5' exoribonuclease